MKKLKDYVGWERKILLGNIRRVKARLKASLRAVGRDKSMVTPSQVVEEALKLTEAYLGDKELTESRPVLAKKKQLLKDKLLPAKKQKTARKSVRQKK